MQHYTCMQSQLMWQSPITTACISCNTYARTYSPACDSGMHGASIHRYSTPAAPSGSAQQPHLWPRCSRRRVPLTLHGSYCRVQPVRP